ncbi:hypothetical protein [Georgenia sp. SYP-B2076]|uniref:hypothetical protein n=1 Tax=Georgenia sp. SYP-B2076 TaxID=2495881 RepID=UPI000F8DD0C6|nr:hypothetical protein [Georgenia sp. SYP-B2076]
MSLLVLLVLIGGPLLVTVIALAAQSLSRGRIDTRQEWKWVRLTWASALVVGGVAAWLVNGSLDLGRGTMLVPAVLGLFVVAGVGLAETVVRPQRPTGPRTASLAPRQVFDYLPRALTTAVGGITALHLATLALTTASASTDDMGRAGRQIAAQCGNTGSGAGPYPGSFYSVPLTMLLLVIGLATVAALMAVVRRPRGFAPDDVGDDVLRLRSTTRVLAAAGAAVAASHVGIAFFAGTALLRMDCQRAWMDPVGWVLVATMPAALLLLGWFLGRIVVPGVLPTPSPAHPAETL